AERRHADRQQAERRGLGYRHQTRNECSRRTVELEREVVGNAAERERHVGADRDAGARRQERKDLPGVNAKPSRKLSNISPPVISMSPETSRRSNSPAPSPASVPNPLCVTTAPPICVI